MGRPNQGTGLFARQEADDLVAQALRAIEAANGAYFVPLAMAGGDHVDDGYVEAFRTERYAVCVSRALEPVAVGLWEDARAEARREWEARLEASEAERLRLERGYERLADLALGLAYDPAGGSGGPVGVTDATTAGFRLGAGLLGWLVATVGQEVRAAQSFLHGREAEALALGWQRRDALLADATS